MIKGNIKLTVGDRVLLFDNLITNTGLSAFIDGGFDRYLLLGTGAFREEPTVTGLEKLSAVSEGRWSTVSRNVVDIKANTITNVHKLFKVFPVEKENKLYSEIAIGNNNGSKIYTYALLRDSTGAPTTITVLKNEQISIEYTVTVVLPYKNFDEESGLTTYIHNIPDIWNMRNASYTSSKSGTYFQMFTDSLERLDAGMPPAIFSGSMSAGYYTKRNNKYATNVATAVGSASTAYQGVYCGNYSSYYQYDFSFSVVFDTPKQIDKDAAYSLFFTIPYN